MTEKGITVLLRLIAMVGIVAYAYGAHPPLLNLLGYSFVIFLLALFAIHQIHIYFERRIK